MSASREDDLIGSLFEGLKDTVAKAQDILDAREAHLCKSEHVGVIGERSAFRLTAVETLGPFAGDWGDRWGYVFHQGDPGETCNVVIWWTTSKPVLAKGESGDFTATVQKHDVHNGTKQTVVQRVKKFDPKLQAAKDRKKREEEQASVSEDE